MQKQKGFFKIEERLNGDIVWNRFPIEKIGGSDLRLVRMSII